MTEAQLAERIPADARAKLVQAGLLRQDATADDLRKLIRKMGDDFRDNAPLSAAGAATIILDGVRSGAWRILVGDDAKQLDGMVRADPDIAYDYAALARKAQEAAQSS
jgi:hypothetical protein